MEAPAQTLRDVLERRSIRWGEVRDSNPLKRFLTNLAAQADAEIPEDTPYIEFPPPGDSDHPLVSEFGALSQKNTSVSFAISRDRTLFVKYVLLRQRDDQARDKCLELRNLWLMHLDLESFVKIKSFLQKIANQESITEDFMTDLVSLANEAVAVKERFEAFNTVRDRQGLEAERWLCDSLIETIQRFISEGEDETMQSEIFRETREFANRQLDTTYSVEPRILSLRFFSIKEKMVDSVLEKELVLITDSLNRDLQRFLNVPLFKLFQKQIINVMIQMTECLHWMHINRFIHGDSKLDNFFILEGPDRLNPLQGARIYLGDLGQSRFFDFTGSNHGYRPFKAPEFGAGRNRKTDIFALGMTLMQVICPNTMKQWVDQFEPTGRRTRNEPNVIPDVPTFDRGLHDLIVSCLNGDPARRPTTSEILQRLRAIHDDTGEDIVLPVENPPPPPPSSHSSPSPSPSPSPHSSPSSSSSSSSDLNTSSYGSS